MIDFISAVKNILEEQNKNTKNLFEDKVISENTFYKYKQRYPSLNTLLKICNYLKISIDYLFELTDKNNFCYYSFNCEIFYQNLSKFLSLKNISGRKFCKDLNFSRDNILRWKNGTLPSLQTLFDISKYFDCLIDDLIN